MAGRGFYTSPFVDDSPYPFEEDVERPSVIPVHHLPEYDDAISITPLEYHWGEEQDHVLLGKDLFPFRRSLSRRVSLICFVAAILEVIPFAWTVVALSIWGWSLQTIYTLVFTIHLVKALFLSFKWCSSTLTYKMRGRNSYHWFTGIWTRLSHVHQDTILLIYGGLYGMVHIPMMILFLVISVASYPLYTSSLLYWITWPMTIVSLIIGYINWCILVSEYGVRKPLERYVDFTPDDRNMSKQQESEKFYSQFTQTRNASTIDPFN